MILAIWKPKGPTSHDVVDAVRRITGERRVGHAGTLDPMAEGVLVVGIGREATKQLASIVAKEKEYIATIALGATSDSDDAEGTITPSPTFSPSHREGEYEGVGRSAVEQVLHHFLGRIEQVPPAYSAVKLMGTPAYKLARRGRTPDLKPRPVEIKTIELLEYAPPRAGKHRQGGKTSGVDRKTPDVELAPTEASGEPASGVEPTAPDVEELEDDHGGSLALRVICGPGTYIRALARDIGRVLGTGGYLTALTRTRVGTYTRENALTIEQFREHWSQIAANQ